MLLWAIDQLARSNVLLILLPMFAPILFVIAVSVVSSALSLLYVLVLIIFFSGPRRGACSVSYPGLLGKFLNKERNNFIQSQKRSPCGDF